MKNKKLLTILGVTTLLVGGMFVNQKVEPVKAADTKTIFLDPGVWNTGGAWYDLWAWPSGGDGQWVTFNDNDGDGIYSANIPANTSDMHILRKEGGKPHDWSCWNRIDNIKIPSGDKTCYYVNNWSEGSWGQLNIDIAGINSWDTVRMTDTDHDGIFEKEFTVDTSTQEFKIIERDAWLGNNGTANDEITDWSMMNGYDNLKWKAKGGKYLVKYNPNTNKTSITCVESVISIVSKLTSNYYGTGEYTRKTTINIDKSKVENDLTSVYDDVTGKYENLFHANAVLLERTTYFTKDALWMSRGNGEYSYYGSEGGNLTNGTAKEANVVPSYHTAVKNTSMEDYYTTLSDINEYVNSATWTKKGNVYSSTDSTLIKYFLAFTAPCFLNLDNNKISNYFTLSSVEIEETAAGLELRLVTSGDSGKLVEKANNVLSVATITK